MSSETPNEGGHKKPPIPTPAKKIPAFNIEKRNDRLYKADSLHKWFAISSLALFIFTVAMVMYDYSREWKQYQREFSRLSVQKAQEDLQQANSSLDRNKLTQLQQQIDQAQAEQQQNEAQIEEFRDKLDELNNRYYAVNQNYQFSKATYDTEKYEYEESLSRAASNVASLKANLDVTEREMNEYKAEVDQISIDRRNTTAELNKFVGKREEARKEIEAQLAEYNRLQIRLNSLDPGLVVTSFRNAPVFDFLNPSERVNQILLPGLFYDHPFKQISRVDRCTTCHLGIDQKIYENAPQPFKTHPNLDLYLAANSSHPAESFGCTTCHGGLDRAVDFQTAGHSPRNEMQRADWVARFGWHEEHYLETPMFPMDQIESGCYKCHSASADVPKAAALNGGRDLIRIYGCFGCHKIPGYEGVRKVGPDLSGLSGKLTKDWVRKWLENPKNFKSEARMPQFWGNDNNKGVINGVNFDQRNPAEINAITEYLFAKSKPGQLPAGRTGGSPARGKQIVENVGCFGCHAAGPMQEIANQSQIRRRHGYNLESQGSKVTASWLFNWVKDAKQVWPETKMPSLRLTDNEAADVAAYLMTLKNPDFEARAVPQADAAALDEITLELLRTGSTDIEAREKLKTMTADQKNLFAGERLISRYGCFGCHVIPGFENAQPIGTELTEAGSKLISQLDFGFLPIEHSRHSWYEQKLTNPRIFDVGRIKRPDENLKMPNFHFDESQVNSITMVLTSLVKDRISLEMRDPLNEALSQGRLLVAEKNCKGCHIIEGAGGDIRPTIAEQAFWPPDLATEGFKTQPLWLHSFVKEPTPLRPWLSARMPTFHFTEEEAATIGRYFSAVDKVPYPFITTEIATTQTSLTNGADLFQKLQCASCHPTSNVIPPGKTAADLAPNLQIAQERLRPDWVLRWLLDPQKVVPGTRMPTFFDQGVTPFPNILGGDLNAQIRAIRDHVFIAVGGGRRAAGPGSTN